MTNNFAFSIAVTTIKLYSSFSHTSTLFSPLTNSTFNLVLPCPGTEEDCYCPVYFNDNAKCYNLISCNCLGNTAFENSPIEFCHLSEGNSMTMQIQNLTNELNGSRLSIFHELFCEYNFIPPYRIYTNSFEIAIGKNTIRL